MGKYNVLGGKDFASVYGSHPTCTSLTLCWFARPWKTVMIKKDQSEI